MKKQIVKSISILSLFVMLSGSAINVSASGGTCSVPSCRPRQNVAASAAAQDVTQTSTQDSGGRAAAPTAQPEDSFSFAFLLMRLMSFLRLP